MVGGKKTLLLTTSLFFLGFSLSSPLCFLCVQCEASSVNECMRVFSKCSGGGGVAVLMGRLGAGLNKR